MNQIFRIILVIVSVILIPETAYSSPNLTIVEISGANYYYYEAHKGDSLYGISKKFGWDPGTLAELNPQISSGIKEGQRIYYPVFSNIKVNENKINSLIPKTINHTVRKGETVYSIASLYGITVDRIYEINPLARDGIKVGQILSITQEQDASANKFTDDDPIYYTVKHGDTLYSLAKEFNTTVENILISNQGLSESNFRAGSIIRIIPNTIISKIRTEKIETHTVVGFNNHKVKKDETWGAISKQYQVNHDDLLAANEGIGTLKKNQIIAIPIIRTDTILHEYTEEDPREKTSAGRMELYQEIHNLTTDSSTYKTTLSILLASPSTKRDQDFTRGVLVALNDIAEKQNHINVKFIETSKGVNELLENNSLGTDGILITTDEKEISEALADYADSHRMLLVNSFDLKSELFNSHPNFLQLLPPTSYFNEAIEEAIRDRFHDYELVFIGNDNDINSDQFLSSLKNSLEKKNISYHQINNTSSLESFNIAEWRKYLLCPAISQKNDVEDFLKNAEKIKEKYPTSSITVLGRPNWIVFAEQLEDKLHLLDTYIPSRFYLDPHNAATTRFLDSYKEMFGHEPIKSYPMYAATAYDITMSLVPAIIFNKGDFNIPVSYISPVQTEINIHRINNWGGFINNCSCLVHYTSYHTVDKIKLK